MASTTTTASGGSHIQGYGTRGYRNFVLYTLTLVYTLNFIDRILISVVAQPIIEEFHLQDWQFGLLSGFGFALMYTLAGIPIARLSERYNRVRIISASVILWSGMTALCGIAEGFIALLVFRIGVGIGEAGCTPPANSLIADYFPPRSRARALAIYTMGITLGGVLANAFGGPVAEMFSWREAFLILGIPGLVVGVLVLIVIKEPPRGYSDPPGTVTTERLGFSATFGELARKPSFWLNIVAASLVAFVGYGLTNFQAAFFQRVHGMSVAEVAIEVAVPLGLAASLGTFAAGYLTERISPRFPNAIAWIPGFGLVLAVPLYLTGISADSASVALGFMLVAAVLHYSYLGAQYTICQGVASPRARATAVALFLFIVNLIGYGLGPLWVGLLSDLRMESLLQDSYLLTELPLQACKASATDLLASLGEAKAQACLTASAEGLRQSLYWTLMIFGLAGAIYLLICRRLQEDLVTRLDQG